MTELGILTLNVCTPSSARAERQLEWLSGRPEQILVLTETGSASGSALLAERLRGAGWELRFAVPPQGERGVLVASRVALGDARDLGLSYLPERVALATPPGLEVIGVYAPSRDESPTKVARKRRFLAELLTLIGERRAGQSILIGDLNIVEPGSVAGGGGFRDWEYELYEALPDLGWLDAYRALHPERVEYSWAEPEGRGFRFDHVFISGGLGDRLAACEYLHETRERDLSDHSAMVVRLEAVELRDLEVAGSLSGAPPSLF